MARATPLPDLTKLERREVQRRAAPSALVVHEVVREAGESELNRRPTALAFSGLAAGLSMGFSLVGMGLLTAYLPNALWRPLVASLGYSIGFLIVVLGRQQLFTENTLTVILPLLAHPNRRTWVRVGRLWGIVLITNLLGAFIFATVVAHTPLVPPQVQRALTLVSRESLRGDFGLTVLRAVFAGWLIALMVWLLPGAHETRLHIIIILTYLVSLGGFSHIIAGSVDTLYLVSQGILTWEGFFVRFLVPTLIGNCIGGVSLVAALNFAQVATQASREM
jgi:formate/nitrite transporter FocA (FNT family)